MALSQTPPRTALITGASGGIGAEYARRLAQRGVAPVLVARRAKEIARIADELTERFGVAAEPLPADLTDAADLARVEERLSGDGDTAAIDVLVNNAGMGAGGAFANHDSATRDAVLALNVNAPVRLTHAALPAMIARREAGERRLLGIVNVSSVAGLLPASPGSALYAASKAFVRSFGESVALEARRHGVGITTVLPGYVRTDMTRGLQERGLPEPAWLSKERVVTDSLRALALGKTSVVPGMRYRAVEGLLRVLPRGLFDTIAARGG